MTAQLPERRLSFKTMTAGEIGPLFVPQVFQRVNLHYEASHKFQTYRKSNYLRKRLLGVTIGTLG